jgi:hypothetical protein
MEGIDAADDGWKQLGGGERQLQVDVEVQECTGG